MERGGLREKERKQDFPLPRRKRIESRREKYANSNEKQTGGALSAYSSLVRVVHRPRRSRLPTSPHPFARLSQPRYVPAWRPDRPPDRKLINECKRANVVDKFNKIVHAQLVSPGVNTFLENVSSLSLCSGIRNFSPLPLNRLGRVSVTAAWITREIILPRIVSLSNNFIVFDKIFCFFFFFYLYRFSKKMENVSEPRLVDRTYVENQVCCCGSAFEY